MSDVVLTKIRIVPRFSVLYYTELKFSYIEDMINGAMIDSGVIEELLDIDGIVSSQQNIIV